MRLALRLRISNFLLAGSLRLVRWRHQRHLARLTRHPRERQDQLLKRILRRQRTSTFGIQHGFATIADRVIYATRVPLSDAATLARWLHYRDSQDANALTVRSPLAGATRNDSVHAAFMKARVDNGDSHARLDLAYSHRRRPDAFHGRILSLRADAKGALAASPAPCAPGLMDRQVVPDCVMDITDSRVRDALILRLAMAHDDLTCIDVADLSRLTDLMRMAQTYMRLITKDVRLGGFFLAHALKPAIHARVASGLVASPRRAQALEALAVRARRPNGNIRLCDLWPRLRLLAVPNVPEALVRLRDGLSEEVELISNAQEFAHTSDAAFQRSLTVHSPVTSGMPQLDRYYYEFIECREHGQTVAEMRSLVGGHDELATLGIESLLEGQVYRVIVSADNGLYRYESGDLAQVTGRYKGLPLLRIISAATHPRAASTKSSSSGSENAKIAVTSSLARLGGRAA